MLDTVQSSRIMESFEKMLPPKALVLRGGNVTEVGWLAGWLADG